MNPMPMCAFFGPPVDEGVPDGILVGCNDEAASFVIYPTRGNTGAVRVPLCRTHTEELMLDWRS